MKKLFIVGLLFVAGCASITTGRYQSIVVKTPLIDGANCELKDSKTGLWYVKDTPGNVMVLKGDGPMTVTCKKDGYFTGMTTVDEDLTGATFGNIILGGGVGIFIDAASGAAQEYPPIITVWMEPKEWQNQELKAKWESEKKEYDDEQERKKNQGKPKSGVTKNSRNADDEKKD